MSSSASLFWGACLKLRLSNNFASTQLGKPTMSLSTKLTRTIIALCIVGLGFCQLHAQDAAVKFKVIAFYTGKDDLAHISFVKEANRWFPQAAAKYHFSYEATTNWNDLTAEKLANYQVVLFLDTRPDGAAQRAAFENYMEHGGAWMGFHFSAFGLTPSAYPQNWDWYHGTMEVFGSGRICEQHVAADRRYFARGGHQSSGHEGFAGDV